MHCSVFAANASTGANVALLVELAMGAGLVFGARLARRGQYRLHAWCQSSIVLLNLVVIAVVMAPSLWGEVLPKIPAKLGRSFYAVAAAHAAAGMIAEVAAIYVLVAAGTTWLPERLRLINFRAVMRTVLVLWWVAIFLGVVTYVRWYARM